VSEDFVDGLIVQYTRLVRDYAAQRSTGTALANVIFRRDPPGPAASHLQVADCIDEWILATHPASQADPPRILKGLI
jgi:hypothetical protein